MDMKPRLQTSLGQQLVLTPQLRQALHLLQLSSLELENEITLAVESNPLLDWVESDGEVPEGMPETPATPDAASTDEPAERELGGDEWEPPDSWSTGSSSGATCA